MCYSIEFVLQLLTLHSKRVNCTKQQINPSPTE